MEVCDVEICQALRGLQQQLLIKHQEDLPLDPELLKMKTRQNGRYTVNDINKSHLPVNII